MTTEQVIALRNVLVLAKETLGDDVDASMITADDIIAKESIELLEQMIERDTQHATELYKKGYE